MCIDAQNGEMALSMRTKRTTFVQKSTFHCLVREKKWRSAGLAVTDFSSDQIKN